MILAHLPSGYLLGRAVARNRATMVAALIGSVAPDFDMVWFYLMDNSIHHHRFWPHIPAIWLMIAVIALPLTALVARRWLVPLVVFLSAIFMHLLLDTVNGGIMWAWPFSDHLYTLIAVPATRSHWILSFLTHWSSVAEFAIIVAAGFFLLKDVSKSGFKHPI